MHDRPAATEPTAAATGPAGATPPHLPAQRGPRPHPSPRLHPDDDALRTADREAAGNLLRCWLRETGEAHLRPGDAVLTLPLPAAGAALAAPVLHRSPTGHHRFGPVHLVRPGRPDAQVTAVELAGLLAGEAATAPEASAPGDDDLVDRVADSVRRTASFLEHRTAHPDAAGRPAAAPAEAFLTAEQALVLGHPAHPAPKSRQGLDEAELRAYSPEFRGGFPLGWLSADPSALAQDSALPQSAAEIVRGLGGPAPERVPDGHLLLPVHPRQLREAAERPAVRALFDAGLLRDLGTAGPVWRPTSSVRTVYRADAPVMLKLSLAVRITNSRRENLRKELHRGVEVHRLLSTGLDAQWRAAHPGFDIVRDPAWIGIGADAEALDGPGAGLDVMIRQNPFAAPGHAAGEPWCVAGLTAPRPVAGEPGVLRSRLDELLRALAARTGEPLPAVAAHWLRRYLQHVVAPVLWLDGEAGIALEAHQQNTLVLLDPDGLPCGGRYRDNQGYYFRESRRAELTARLPGLGEVSDTFVPDHVTDERFAYYLAVNNACGLIGALGSQGLGDETELLGVFRDFLAGQARTGRSPLPGQLLDAPRLRCKANLLTRLQGMDELVGPVETQSVYVTIDNPVAAAR